VIVAPYFSKSAFFTLFAVFSLRMSTEGTGTVMSLESERWNEREGELGFVLIYAEANVIPWSKDVNNRCDGACGGLFEANSVLESCQSVNSAPFLKIKQGCRYSHVHKEGFVHFPIDRKKYEYLVISNDNFLIFI
jgi:hypothetical protein